MTTTANQREGQVFDLGYRHYDGPREGRSRARIAIYMDGLRAALGIGRGGRAKILPWIFIFAAVMPALVMALIAGTIDRLGASGAADLPSHSDYYFIASIILFLFAAASAPELLCPDKRNRVIILYLVRPLTGTDYILARWLAFLTVMLFVAWLPQLVLLAGLVFGAQQPADYLADNWQDIPKFLVSGAAIAIYTTSLAMAVAAFTSRRAYAAVFLIGLFVVSTPLTAGLSESISGSLGEWIALLNLTNIPLHINDLLFGSNSLGDGNRVVDLPRAARVASFFVATGAAFFVMWSRYRKISA